MLHLSENFYIIASDFNLVTHILEAILMRRDGPTTVCYAALASPCPRHTYLMAYFEGRRNFPRIRGITHESRETAEIFNFIQNSFLLHF